MSYLNLRNISKQYGSFHAVRGLNLQVEEGEFLSLLGPSGCGKTTTLQMVAGFVVPTDGSVSVNGKDLTKVRPEARDMGVVFQSYALFPHMTVAQNVGFGLEMRKLKRPEIRTRVDEALAMVRLAGLEGRYPSQLSGGQRQRVAIARALAIRPSVLLLDEPMSNLDTKLRGEMHVELRALQRRLGITTILVTHDQVEAMTMSDRIAVMTDGAIAHLGSPRDVYDAPRSEFACRFLGQTNIVIGQVQSRDANGMVLRLGSVLVRIESREPPAGSEVRLSIRPERLRIGAPGQGHTDARVNTRLFLGNTWLYDIDSDLGKLRVTVQNSGTAQPGEGEAIGLSWDAADLLVVSSESSQ